MILADKLIDLRKKNGWSQEELAEKLDVSRQAVSKWEGAQSIPDMSKIIQLSELFGVSTDYSPDLPYEYLEKEPIDTLYGVTGMVKDRKERFQPIHTRYLLIGILLCIASVIPLFICLFFGKESFWGVIGIASVLVMAAIGVLLIVRVSIVWGSYQMLLEEEEYSRESKENSKHYGYICGVYWCLITAAYLAWSFIGYHWNISWIIWPIAGVVFGAVMGITKALKRR